MTPVDLHNKEFCVDVSAFKPLEWVEQEGESCSTEFVKQCEEKRENVCADVTETVCDVVPYTGMGGVIDLIVTIIMSLFRVHHGDGGAALLGNRAGAETVC